MLLRGVALVLGVVFRIIAVVSTERYMTLASGTTIVDFIPWETNAESQRQHLARMGRVAMVRTLGCLASSVFGFYCCAK